MNLLKSKKVFIKKKHTISKKITHFESLINSPYKYGFSTEVNTDQISEGLNLETLEKISALKNENENFFKFRVNAFKKWKQMKTPAWAELTFQKLIIN